MQTAALPCQPLAVYAALVQWGETKTERANASIWWTEWVGQIVLQMAGRLNAYWVRVAASSQRLGS